VKVMAEAAGIPVMQPTRLKDPDWLAQLGVLDLDLGVVAAYGRLLPDDLLRLPRLGMITVPPSLLPRYRGASPIHQAFLAGDTETGVTIMRVVQTLDAGAMLDVVRVPIGADDTSGDVEARLAVAGAALLVAVVDRLALGTVTETPQDERRVSLAPLLAKNRGLVDWTQPARVVHNQVRGLQPWPGAWTYLDGHRLGIRRTALRPQSGVDDAPGTVVQSGQELQVMCGDGASVALLEVQPEGRRAMSGREFLLGHPVPPGTRMTSAPS
jgi:methionyl-tRNA formyltransferase